MRRSVSTIVLSAMLAASPMSYTAMAQDGPDVTFELRPHCEQSDHAAADNEFGGEVPAIEGTTTLTEGSALPCREFAVRDPLSRQTDILKMGDTLDMDLIMHNPSGRSIKRFRTWIGYDSSVLQGMAIEVSPSFPGPLPGEADFSPADNYVKVSGTSEQPTTEKKIVLARITMKVISTPAIGGALYFYDPGSGASAHTGAFGEGDSAENVAAAIQGSLAVRLQAAAGSSASSVTSEASSAQTTGTGSSASSIVSSAASSTSSTVSTATSSSTVSSSSSSVPPPAPVAFAKLQVQALRVTTEGSSAFLAWNPLPSSSLAGYNLYYGTISGRYLQRRAVDMDSQTVTIRALPVGQSYYFAIRAVNGQGEESDFSQEVAVTIGNPATSTSPLSGALIEGGPNGNAPDTNGNISGESGPATWLLAFAAASAVTGTMLAFRRQWTAVSDSQR